MKQYGAIITEQEFSSYGKVLETVKISKDQLVASKPFTQDNLYFRVESGLPFILGDGRSNILNHKTQIDAATVFTRFSLSVIDELLNKGSGDEVLIHKMEATYDGLDENVIVIQYGTTLMQKGSACPPWCD